ncbi:MAG: family 1 glycosylhydrolase [Myxococcota bacterium]
MPSRATPSSPPPYPPGFLWGVATAAHQVEGGLCGPGQPRNNWAAFEDTGRAERTGLGCDFWHRWEDDLDLARDLGINAFRMGLEWVRVEPAPGVFDEAALDRYAAIIAGARRRGMEPVVTLQHFTHPEWLGPDPWLDEAVPARFGRHARETALAIGKRLVDRQGQPPVRFWVTVNEPNSLCLATYYLHMFPRGLRHGGPRALSRALCGIMRAHVHARRALHDLAAAEGWPEPTVTYNAWACASYAVDRYLVDLLRPETRGRTRELGREFRKAVGGLGVLGRIADFFLRRAVKPELFAPLVADLGKDEDALDALAFDYYDPFLGDYVGWRGMKREPWQWPTRPERLPRFAAAYLGGHAGKRLFVLENGIGTRPTAVRGRHRPDRLGRDRALAEAIGAVDRCVAAGLPMAGYFHWSLIDNYEWGSFAPRFGLHGVDRGDGLARLASDITGVDAASAYRALVRERAPRVEALSTMEPAYSATSVRSAP